MSISDIHPKREVSFTDWLAERCDREQAFEDTPGWTSAPMRAPGIGTLACAQRGST
jgi:hypothetical protein